MKSIEELEIAIIQVRKDASREHEQKAFIAQLGLQPEQLQFFDIYTDSIEPEQLVNSVDGIILPGSAENVSKGEPENHIETLKQIVHSAVDRKKPLFGICYGAHLIAEAMGGVVEYKPETKELASVEMFRLATAEGDPLFSDVPEEFIANCTRTDDIVELPLQAIPLVNSNTIQFHAFKLIGVPVWATQFHPELDQQFERERLQLGYDLYKDKFFSSIEELHMLKEGVQDTPEASSLLRKFIEYIAQQ